MISGSRKILGENRVVPESRDSDSTFRMSTANSERLSMNVQQGPRSSAVKQHNKKPLLPTTTATPYAGHGNISISRIDLKANQR